MSGEILKGKVLRSVNGGYGLLQIGGQTVFARGALKGENEVVPIPEEYQARYQEYSEHLTEAVASTDDDLIERMATMTLGEFLEDTASRVAAPRDGIAAQ